MYFASDRDAASGMCIGVATATAAAGPFTDVGVPLMCASGIEAIDPMEFEDPQSGKRYLYWGSGGAPITVRELSADGRSFADGSTPTAVLFTGSGPYDSGLIEGVWVTYHAPYYYLYFSGNACCGAGAHYAVMVARSSSPTGPFEKLTAAGGGAQPILRGGGKWGNPGHNSVVTDAAGAEWMVYHAIDANQPYLIPGRTDISRRPMLIDKITYANGWPTVGAAGFPTSTPQTRPATAAAP
jgi:arabinan endo-1,5-alpha-L-arabinosidase